LEDVEGRVDVGKAFLVGREVDVVLPDADAAGEDGRGRDGRRRRGLGPRDRLRSDEPRGQGERRPDRDKEGRPTAEGAHAHLFGRRARGRPTGFLAILTRKRKARPAKERFRKARWLPPASSGREPLRGRAVQEDA